MNSTLGGEDMISTELNRRVYRVLIGVAIISTLFLLAGCGKNKIFVGRYKELDDSWEKRYLEINEDNTARLFDSYDTMTGEWKVVKDKKSLEMTLSEYGTEVFNAEFLDGNTDIIKVTGGYYGSSEAYYVRESSDTYNKVNWDNVSDYLDSITISTEEETITEEYEDGTSTTYKDKTSDIVIPGDTAFEITTHEETTTYEEAKSFFN